MMTNRCYETKNPKTNHHCYGGQIYHNDFYRQTTLSEITARIISDQKFDMECMRNSLNREYKKVKGGTQNA